MAHNPLANGLRAPSRGEGLVVISARQIVFISDWRPFVKNTLQAFFTVTLLSGMVIRSCGYLLAAIDREGLAR